MSALQTAVLICDGRDCPAGVIAATLPAIATTERVGQARNRAAANGWTKGVRNGSRIVDYCPACSMAIRVANVFPDRIENQP